MSLNKGELNKLDGITKKYVDGLLLDIKNIHTSGLYEGGVVTINSGDDSKIDITAGRGILVDYWTTPGDPIIYNVTWDSFIGVTVSNIATSTLSYVGIDINNLVIQFANKPTGLQRETTICLAQLGHSNLTNVRSVNSYVSSYGSPMEQLRGLITGIGYISDGNIITANGSNLNINKSSGSLYSFGVNFYNDVEEPNKIQVAANIVAPFRYRTQLGGTSIPVTLIDPTMWDDAGTITSIGGGVNRSTNQRVFLFPNGNLVIQYGQTIYQSLTDAIEGIQQEDFNVYSNVALGACLVGIISMKRSATDLSDTNNVKFFRVGKFGESVGSASGTSTTTLQGAYNNSNEPEITTNVSHGAISIKSGTTDSDNLLEFINGSDLITSRVTGDGKIYSDYITSGTISTNNYTLPSVDGSNGQVMTTDGSGTVSWQTPSGGGGSGLTQQQIEGLI